MCPVWLLVAVTAMGVGSGAVSRCWEHPSCQEECIQLCLSDLTAETPVVPGDGHLQRLSLSDPESLPSPSPQAKRSYSMEHFRWGKPESRRIKVYTSDGAGEESAEDFPGEVRRREQEQDHGVHEKKDGTYKMKHFRWSDPPTSKRDSGSQGPLLTLFQNIISKDGQEPKREQ